MFGLVATSTVTHADTTNQTNPNPVVDPANQIKTKTDYQQDINQTQNQIQQLQNQQQNVQQQVTQDQNAQQEYQNNQQQLAQAQQTYQQNYTPVDNQNVSLPQAYIDGLKHASEDQQAGQQFRQIANPQVQTHAYTPDTQAAQENIDLSHLTDNQVYRANLFANGLVNRFRQSYGTAPIQQNADAQHYTQQVADALLKTGTTGHSSLLDGAGENLGQTFAYADANTAKQMQGVHLDTIKPSDIVMQNHVDGNKQWNTWGFKPGVMITTMDDLYADIYYNVCQMLFNDSGLESWGHATNYLIHNTGKTYTGFAIEPIKTTGTVYIFTTTFYGDGHKKTTSKPVQVPMIDLITRWQYRSNTNKRPINPANDWNDQSKTAKSQIDKLTVKQSELKKTLAKAQDNQNQLKKINTQLSQLNNKLTQLKQAQKQAPEHQTSNSSNVITLPSHKNNKPTSSANSSANKPASSASHSQADKPTKPDKPANSANSTADKPAQPAKSTSSSASQSQAATPSTPNSSSASQAVKPSESASSANNNAEKPAQPAKSDSASQAVKPSQPTSSANSSANKPASSADHSQATKPAKPGKPANSANSTTDKPAQPAKSDSASQTTKPASSTSSSTSQSQAATPSTSASSSASQAVKPSKSASSANNNTEKSAQPAKSDGASQAVKPSQPTSSANSSAETPAQPVNSSASQAVKPNTPASSTSSDASYAASNANTPASSKMSQAVEQAQPASSASHNETVNFDSISTASPVTITFPEEPKKTAVKSQRPIVEFPSDDPNATVGQVLTKNSKTSTNEALPQTGNAQRHSFAAALVGLLVGADAMAIAKKIKARR